MNPSIRTNTLHVSEQVSLSEALLGFNFIRSVEKAQELIQSGRVFVGGAKTIEDIVVKDVDIVLETSKELEPEVATNIDILYEDEYLLVVNKPAPLPVHPAGKYYFNTVTNFLGGELYPVHRLDKETTGVLVLAKSKEVAVQLGREFTSGKVEKTYVALVQGKMTGTGSISYPLLQKDYLDIRHHVTVDVDGESAHTTYAVLATHEKYSLLQLGLHTGRKHQLRAHMAALGHPIVGDKQYLKPSVYSRLVREGPTDEDLEWLSSIHHLLHAQKLSFKHPKGVRLSFEAELDEEFSGFLENSH